MADELRSELTSDVAAVVGASHVLVAPDLTARYRTDWTGRFGGHDAVVVRPATIDETSAVIRIALVRGVPVVPQGGNTGLVGGSVPSSDGAIVLSTDRLTTIGALDYRAGQITVGAGVTLSALGDALEGSGWRFAVDLGARDSATIGGMVATNAGGMRVFRFGPMRAQVMGLEYVRADGEVVQRLGGLVKDNTGYDVASLICGSEGTLAIVTAVRLRLVVDPTERTTALLGFRTAVDARHAAWALRRACPAVEVIEYISGACADLVSSVGGVDRPIEAPELLLVEAAAESGTTELLGDAAAALEDVVLDVAVAEDEARRSQLWRFRDDITTSLATLGPVAKYDVSIPSRAVDVFRSEVGSVVGAFDADAWWFGHVCDDNLHLNVTRLDPRRAVDLDGSVLALVAGHGGSISAEHGIGRSKARYLHLARSSVEIELFRAVKAAFDPHGILNPGVILEA